MRPRRAGLKILFSSGLIASTSFSGSGAVSGSAQSFIMVSVRGVRRQEDDGVLEVDLAPLAVLEHPLVEDLVEELHDVGVRLLDLVEEDDGVGPAPDRLGQDAALAVADVARRRALERRDGVRLLVLAHVDRDQVALAAVEHLGERQGRLGLADAARPDEQEDADGPARIRQVRAGGADPAGDRLEARATGR